MRILLISDHWPWPEHSGASQRTATTVETLSDMGEVDFFYVDRHPEEVRPLWDSNRFARAARIPVPREKTMRRLLRRIAHPLLPALLAELNGRAARELAYWAGDREYDLVWCVKEVAWLTVRRSVPQAPVVLDVDDLYEVTAQRWQMTKSGFGPVRRALEAVSMWHLRSGWRRAHSRHARRAMTLLVCSEVDRARIPAHNVQLLENCYRGIVSTPSGGPTHAPTLIFQGSLTYYVNEDAVRYLLQQILPQIRQRIPDVRFIVVGFHDNRLDDLAGRSGVVVTGAVDDMAPWLDQAHVQVVPLRAGSGTRTKILEATAKGLPVVSTSVGAEGLPLRDGEEICIADDPTEFAERCTALLLSRNMRIDLARAAQHALRPFLDTRRMRSRIGAIARQAAGLDLS